MASHAVDGKSVLPDSLVGNTCKSREQFHLCWKVAVGTGRAGVLRRDTLRPDNAQQHEEGYGYHACADLFMKQRRRQSQTEQWWEEL